MFQDDGSSSVTSTPVQIFPSMSVSSGMGSPYPWLKELKSEERGLCLIHLLLTCAKHVASGNFEHANIALDQISHLASPEGDTMQRIASYFAEALANRILKTWPGIYKAIHSTKTSLASENILVRKMFFEYFPVYDQAASNLVAGSNLEGTVQHILDMGGGIWDRDTVIRALRAAFNNPERAVEYLYSGIPEPAELPPAAGASPVPGVQAVNPPAQVSQATQPPVVPSTGPNANPLDLFPQGLPDMGANAPAGAAGNLDFLRSSPQFQALRAMVQANPQILQPMLQELGKQNPHLVRLIQEHQADFLRLINEPVEGGENVLGDLAAAMPQAVTVTPEEREAIERLEAMGFDRALVLEVFFACNKNEELAANYLLDHMHEFED